jgi:hypothetical protein
MIQILQQNRHNIIKSKSEPIKSKIEGWSINGTENHEHQNCQKTSEHISTTNDNYHQHGVSTCLAFSSIIKPEQVLRNLACGKLPTTVHVDPTFSTRVGLIDFQHIHNSIKTP